MSDLLTICLRAFGLTHSILNTHPAYIDFRAARRKLRLAGEDVVGLKLIGKLGNYSEKGEEYVRKIKNIIKLNQLEQFDGARYVAL